MLGVWEILTPRPQARACLPIAVPLGCAMRVQVAMQAQRPSRLKLETDL